jgi:hypothetical protein
VCVCVCVCEDSQVLKNNRGGKNCGSRKRNTKPETQRLMEENEHESH